MESNFLIKLAQAHQRHEGWYPGSVSYRQNNPGNLRFQQFHATAYGAVPGDQNFAKFPTYALGFQALKDDIRAKITGKSRHIDYSANPTFFDYIKVYAPAEDRNNPSAYTQSLINQLPEYHLSLDTPLSEMAAIIYREENTPVTWLPPYKNLEQRLRILAHALRAPYVKPERKKKAQRVYDRIAKRLGL